MGNTSDKNEFGLPIASYDPMKSILMEGQMFRGIGDDSRERSLFLRVVTILFCLLFFLLRGIFLVISLFNLLLGIDSSKITDTNDYVLLGSALIGCGLVSILFVGAGYKGIRANIKRRHKKTAGETS